MRTLGNILWFIFGGFFLALSWIIIGLLFCITLIGIPVGKQCFKMASLTIAPFKKEVVNNGGAGSLVLNILWMIFFGFGLAMGYIFSGIILCVTVVGIPFGMQCFKMVTLALFPFGAEIRDIQ